MGRRPTAPAPLQAEFPAGCVLRDYQVQGATQIANARRFLLLDDPGVGKTVTTIAGLLEIQARGGKVFPAVIIVPSWDVADVWQREISAWAPRWRTALWGGAGRDTTIALNQARPLITTYSTPRNAAADVH